MKSTKEIKNTNESILSWLEKVGMNRNKVLKIRKGIHEFEKKK